MNPAPQISQQVNDIQATLVSGFGWLTSSRFWLLTIKDPALARDWILKLQASGLIQNAAQIRSRAACMRSGVTEVASIAFSFAGLRELGLQDSQEFPFPTPFRSGMSSELRSAILRDGSNAKWSWGDTAPAAGNRETVHVLVGHWWDNGNSTSLRMPSPCLRAFTASSVQGCPSFFRAGKLFEPFGFRDGLSQPIIFGLREETRASELQAMRDAGQLYRDHVVATGEFIVGYRNEYDQLTYAADVTGWSAVDSGAPAGSRFTLNGSYLAVRQIEQHVERFKAWEEKSTRASAGAAHASIAEKLMGRRKDGHGTPLGWGGSACPESDSQANSFRYRVQDANGFMCPLGAHVRRANPRDALGHDVQSGIKSSKLHRLLRRGRPYRNHTNHVVTEGIFFIACNADLERQFEFVQQRWLRNPRFAKLNNEDDPLVGAATTDQVFSMPGLPTGKSISLDSFTKTLGGGYFFLPGLRALRFIACGPPAVAAVTSASAAGSAA